MSDKWTVEKSLLDNYEDENDTNPTGYWLSNSESNEVFILPEDLTEVIAILTKVKEKK